MKILHTIFLTMLSVLILSTPVWANLQEADDVIYSLLHNGKVWGQLQSVSMTQNWDKNPAGDKWSGEASSSSMSIKLGYESAFWNNLCLGTEMQKVGVLWEENDDDAKKNLNNGTESINQLYVRYKDDMHDLQVGRQFLKLDFLSDNPIRSKIQYYEVAIYQGKFSSKFDILFGHVTKFSGLSKEWFKDISSTFNLSGAIDRNGNIISGTAKDNIGDTDGVSMGYLTWNVLPTATIEVYDYWFYDIINIGGGNIYLKPPIGDATGIFKARIAKQDSIGELDDIVNVNSCLAELSAGFQWSALELHVGYTLISDPETNETNKIFVPYDSAFFVDSGMLGTSLLRSFEAGSETLWFEGGFNKGDFKSLVKLWLTEEDNKDDNIELDIILKYNFTKRFYAQSKNAFGWFDNYYGPGEDMNKQDHRLFIGYNF